MEYIFRSKVFKGIISVSVSLCNVCKMLICKSVYLFNVFGEHGRYCSGAPCPTDYPLRSVSGRFGSARVSRDCSCVQALSHLLDARQRARVFETLPPKTELWLWL